MTPTAGTESTASAADAAGTMITTGAAKKLLVRDGAELCFGCHPKEKALLQAAWVHAPFKDGDCASCHDPHASPNAAQALEALPALCTNCHDLAEAKAKAKHASAPKGALCTSCHNPHGAQAKRL